MRNLQIIGNVPQVRRESNFGEYLQKKLNRLGFPTVVNGKKGEYRISLSLWIIIPLFVVDSRRNDIVLHTKNTISIGLGVRCKPFTI